MAGAEGHWRDMTADEGVAAGPVLTPATAPGDERGRGEAGDQAENAAGQDPAGIGVAGIADAAQREEEYADTEECCREAEHAIEGLHPLL
jgi:hypothetical protein